jgi:hypothetical protein
LIDGFYTKLLPMKKILLICLGIVFGSSAYANQTCKYQDVDGRIIYANVPIKGAKKLMCFGPDAATSGSAASSRSRIVTPTPADFPRVDGATQKQRDNKRQQILEDELANERKALEQAKQAYVEGEANPEVYRTKDGKTMRNVAKYEEKMQSLRSNVELHEKNIQLLEKELAGIK